MTKDMLEKLSGVKIKSKEGVSLKEICTLSVLQTDFILKLMTKYLYLCYMRRKNAQDDDFAMEYDKIDFLQSLLKGECRQRVVKAEREDEKGQYIWVKVYRNRAREIASFVPLLREHVQRLEMKYLMKRFPIDKIRGETGATKSVRLASVNQQFAQWSESLSFKI